MPMVDIKLYSLLTQIRWAFCCFITDGFIGQEGVRTEPSLQIGYLDIMVLENI